MLTQHVIDHARIAAYAELTNDHNPIHLDPAFAANTRYGRPIAYGTLGLNCLWAHLDQIGIEVTATLFQIRFVAPVTEGERLSLRSSGRNWEIVRQSDGEVVILVHATGLAE